MGYCVIDTPEKVEVHSDMCELVFEKKDNYQFNNIAHFIEFFTYEEVENFLKNIENKEIIFCEVCNPQTKEYDEEGDDFYVEFDEDDENECLI